MSLLLVAVVTGWAADGADRLHDAITYVEGCRDHTSNPGCSPAEQHRRIDELAVGASPEDADLFEVLRFIAPRDDGGLRANKLRALFGEVPDMAAMVRRASAELWALEERGLSPRRRDMSGYESEAELLADAEAAVARVARDAAPHFRVLPEAPCGVLPERTGAVLLGGYRGGLSLDVADPSTTWRAWMVPLARHECWGGHHLQLSWPSTFGDRAQISGFIEGWAMYAEQDLAPADERGGPALGAYLAWRYSRLIVDVGLHEEGWTAEHARAFLRSHTALPERYVVAEVGRMVDHPGWLTSHAIGWFTFHDLRVDAERRLGDAFDEREYHDVVLALGVIPLPLLRARVERYVAARLARDSGL